MSNKLNLSIDEEVVRRTKRYSKINNISISKLVQNYLDELTAPQKNAEKNLLEKYRGVLNGQVSDEQVLKIKEERNKAKYGL
jgi:hypothetical protein